MSSLLPTQAVCLIASNASLKDIKSEMLLFIVRDFLYEFLQQDDTNSVHLIEAKNEQEVKEEKLIQEFILRIFNYLDKHVLTRKKLNDVFTPSVKNNKTFLLAKQNEPIWFYYNSLARIVEDVMREKSEFVPEVIGLEMLRIYIDEEGKKIPKHKLFESLDFSPIFSFYDKKNIELKKTINPSGKIWDTKTHISDAYTIAAKIIEKYSKISYKLNINRISKTRKKGKK